MSTGFDDQLMYKLATIETKVTAIDLNIAQAISRLELRISSEATSASKDLNEAKVQLKEKITAIEHKAALNEKRIDTFEDWKNMIVAKVGAIVAIVGLGWAAFGTHIEQKIGSLF